VSAPSVRPIDPDELITWMTVVRTAMLGRPPTPEDVEAHRPLTDVLRCLAAVDGDGRFCGTARSFATELTVPGGELVPAAAVSGVGVLPTHRRQGHLTRLMDAQLRDVADRGEPVAVLIAAEYPIYRRYGYGPATQACMVQLDADPDGWVDAPTGRAELVDAEELAQALVDVYDRARHRAAGHISWDKHDWEYVAGVRRMPGASDPPPNVTRVVWRDPQGTVQGAAFYSVDGRWTQNRPDGEAHVELLVAATDEAERELARFLTSVDWVGQVRLNLRPVDDPLPLWRHDGRSARLVDHSDHVWVRVLDVPAALERRRYDIPGRLAIDVVDPRGFAHGRYLLDAGPDGATCRPTDAEADLTVPVAALGAAYLGGTTWGQLAAAGWVDELRPGAVATASALFATPRAPWCPRIF
jgi:predicted acetyltransferase